jgi:C4-dicarboxylate transporter, DctM subunit
MTIPELTARGYPEDKIIATLAGAGTLGLLIPPSIIMIVYGVTADVSISQLFIAGIIPGIMLAGLFSGYIVWWALRNPEQVPPIDRYTTFKEKISASRHLIPVVLLIAAVQGMTGKQITWFSRVTLPMFWLMVGAVLLVYFVPALVTWLPKQMMG